MVKHKNDFRISEIKKTGHVLIIAYGFPPSSEGGVFRTLRFVKYLNLFGWQPSVLTVKNGFFGRKDPSLLAEIPKSVQVFRARSIEPGPFLSTITRFIRTKKPGIQHGKPNSTTRIQSNKRVDKLLHKIYRFGGQIIKKIIKVFFFPDQKIGWLPFLITQIRSINYQAPIDIIYTSGGPWTAHVAGAWAKKILHIPWIADYRDFWTLYRHPSQVAGGKLRLGLDTALEKQLMKIADLNIFVTEHIRLGYIKKYPNLDPQKMRTLTNGFDPQDFKASEVEQFGKRLTIIHTGTASGSIYRMDVFFKALDEWFHNHHQFRRKLQFRFIGELGNNQIFIDQYNLRDVVLCESAVPHSEITRMMQTASVLLIVLGEHSPATRAMKTLEYLAAKRPIWAICVEGATSEIIRKGSCGWVSEPTNELSIRNTLSDIMEIHSKGYLDRFCPTPEYVDRFDGRKLTGQLAEWMTELVNKKAMND